MTNATERRCKATTQRGRCRATRGINAAGFCAAHDPERPVDYRELGRKSAQARKRPHPERVHESLREYLKREVPPERVWQALEAAMLGNSESARVSASRVLMDALHEPEQDGEERRKADRQRAAAEARAYLAAEIDRRARVMNAAEVEQVRRVLEEVADWLDIESIKEHPDLILGDISVEAAEQVFAGLEEVGLLVRAHRVEELVEERAQERLLALRQEHGIPA